MYNYKKNNAFFNSRLNKKCIIGDFLNYLNITTDNNQNSIS